MQAGQLLRVTVDAIMEPRQGSAGGRGSEGGLRVTVAEGITGFIPFMHLGDR